MNLVTVTAQTRITDPETLQLLADEIVQIAEQRVDPDEPEVVQELPIQPDKPRPPKAVLQRTVRARVRDWVSNQISQPRRIVRWLSWWWAIPWRAGSFVSVITSKRVDPETLLDRDTECNDCEQRYYYVRLNGKMSSHCAACKCPAWSLSTLWVKNQLSGWHCPLRKHPGPYPNDRQVESLKGLGYAEGDLGGVAAGGCTGCGCGKAGK